MLALFFNFFMMIRAGGQQVLSGSYWCTTGYPDWQWQAVASPSRPLYCKQGYILPLPPSAVSASKPPNMTCNSTTDLVTRGCNELITKIPYSTCFSTEPYPPACKCLNSTTGKIYTGMNLCSLEDFLFKCICDENDSVLPFYINSISELDKIY